MADGGQPQLPLQLVDPLGQLGGTARDGDVRVGPAACREADGVVRETGAGTPARGGHDRARPGARPRAGAGLSTRGRIGASITADSGPVARSAPGSGHQVGPGRFGPGDADRTLLAHEVVHLRQAGGIGPQPAPEAVLDALEMG